MADDGIRAEKAGVRCPIRMPPRHDDVVGLPFFEAVDGVVPSEGIKAIDDKFSVRREIVIFTV